jgi:hypothetical protein
MSITALSEGQLSGNVCLHLNCNLMATNET